MQPGESAWAGSGELGADKSCKGDVMSEHITDFSVRDRAGLGNEAQICCLLSASVLAPVGALGAVLGLSPCEEASGGFVCESGLQSKAQSLEHGLRWDGCSSLCPGCVEKGFQRWLQVGDTFCSLS